ncbi:MAG: hypothetical protein P5678_09285 [Limnospira sp. PMC 1240.20]|uniref:Uncharacterized protein n=1 Tax=Limnospira fusiformis PMC 851.14 TaxID=2219512 RepID=A0ABU9EK02_LIMFS|nr:MULTISPECIES: hypothetical protein [unclassified Limnospira]EKD06499.1 hypothetical protein SPLC1_S530920 [Arthrospira platensis C1]MDT9210163.1 hypothetical protein [Limnospira sp. PMC 1252.20]MDT9218754.1 hypothetical protein [Limnospira sp. PMC 1240.20]MDT9228986.1 hypothetical protein [Limnospira sp. PMC 1242.20]MDT9239594.1 hypothetical protein [Limnospira sp. PMC 1261.20]
MNRAIAINHQPLKITLDSPPSPLFALSVPLLCTKCRFCQEGSKKAIASLRKTRAS